MLFSKEYDRSLWLITQSDKNTCEMITEFLKKLTKEMYQCIYQLQANKTFKQEETKYATLSGADFSFLVEIEKNTLTISLNKFDSNNRFGIGERYELQLVLLDEKFLGIEKYKNIYIGSFNYATIASYSTDDNGFIMSNIKNDRYVFKKTNFGYVVNSFPAYSHNLKSSQRVNVSKMPDVVSLESFKAKKRKRCFDRKR